MLGVWLGVWLVVWLVVWLGWGRLLALGAAVELVVPAVTASDGVGTCGVGAVGTAARVVGSGVEVLAGLVFAGAVVGLDGATGMAAAWVASVAARLLVVAMPVVAAGVLVGWVASGIWLPPGV